ncbi:MAG TPA: FemAB family XrtA/PEP-CTERM system-associated protein [Longimicrobiales bacterium]|nr:FemAB family XrtA/PEP-CTERM system-associated protein [Longimicrobiales bacterium]
MSTVTTHPVQLRVARADRDDTHWDAFVREAPESTFCQLSGWRGIVEDVLGREYLPLVAVTMDGAWQGVLPLVRVRTPLLGHSLISMPYVNYGGPLGTPAAQRVLMDAAVAEAQRSGAGVLQVRCRPPLPSRAAADEKKVMVLLDLPDTPEALWSQFPSKVRSQIRRPQKEGMTFRVGPDQLDAFYTVFARNMRDLGTPVYSRRFFEAVAATFPEVVFGAIYHQGRPIGAAAGFIWKGEFEITWASCIRDYNRLAPNMLLYWSFMEEMIGRGVRVFNFGRSTPGASTHRFKKQWGGRDVPLRWLEWTARPRTSSSPSRLVRAASSAWQRLPLPVANRIGPPLASRLPWW